MTSTKDKKREASIDPGEPVSGAGGPEISPEILEAYPQEERSILKTLFGVTYAAAKFISKGALTSGKVGDVRMMQEAGAYLRDLREVAGLTRREVSNAINLADESLLTAVENGTASLSTELILRLAALLARHDPIPFIIRFIRTYNPAVWGVLETLGWEKLPLQLEREREFINIYRSRDSARLLSDEGFQRVLEFTRSAFDMALHFVSEEEK